MRLRYFLGLIAALLFTACSVDVDVEYTMPSAPCTIQVTWTGNTASSITGKVTGLSTGEVSFTAGLKSAGVYEAVVSLPAKLPSSARVVIEGTTYKIALDADRVIKIKKI